jgi:hypothetical protein
MPLPQLRRVRWAVRATLTLGVAASVAANILHARPNPISQVIAAWPPLALLLTVELISRVPVHRRSLAAVRLAATATIAGIAAWVSYWHMAGVAARYGETGPSPYLLPLSVDGLVIVASVSLVELAGRIRTEEATVAAAVTVDAVTEPVTAEPAPSAAVPIPDGATVIAPPGPAARAPAQFPSEPAPAAPTERATAALAAPTEPATAALAAPTEPATAAEAAGARPKRSPSRRTSPSRDEKPAPAKAVPRKTSATATATHAGRSAEETAALAARMKADQPHLTQAAIAATLGITTQRLRQINRQAVTA